MWTFQSVISLHVLKLGLNKSMHASDNEQRISKLQPKPPVLNMSGLRIWQGCEYARITQGAEYAWISHNALTIPQYVWICLNNAEYDSICRHILEKTEYWTCQNSECFWCNVCGTRVFGKYFIKNTRKRGSLRETYWSFSSEILLKLHFQWKI